MKKVQVLDINGNKIKEINTVLFEDPIRKDIIYKIIEAEKQISPYKPKLYSGMNRSASGNVTHKRHTWKTDRGRGMSRIPKKTMWRRGTQFSWIGAIVPNTRGGRRAHPPKGIILKKKINKKEYIKALLSSLSLVCLEKEIIKKYDSLKDKKIVIKLPLVVEDKLLKLKTKDFLKTLKLILKGLYEISIKKRKIRAGIGKMRGRKYKKNAGLLIVISNDEEFKIKGFDIVKTKDLKIANLASGGARLTMFTEKAVKEMEKLKNV
jgi:large subunit ribosomal protein L4e